VGGAVKCWINESANKRLEEELTCNLKTFEFFTHMLVRAAYHFGPLDTPGCTPADELLRTIASDRHFEPRGVSADLWDLLRAMAEALGTVPAAEAGGDG
jgi:hypothetical protein